MKNTKPQMGMNEWRDKFWSNDLGVRKSGVVAIVSGLVVGLLCIYWPIADALKREAKIMIWYAAPFLTVAALLFGVLMLILGKRAELFLRIDEKRPPTLQSIAAYIICIGLALLIGFSFNHWITSQGYVWHSIK